MSVNINSHKIGINNSANSRTPQISMGVKKAAINNSVFTNQKSPITKSIKKAGVRRSRPPLYERELPDVNVSSLPVIINSLSISHKHTSDSQSPDLLRRYELKGKILKPSQRLAYMKNKNKVSR